MPLNMSRAFNRWVERNGEKQKEKKNTFSHTLPLFNAFFVQFSLDLQRENDSNKYFKFRTIFHWNFYRLQAIKINMNWICASIIVESVNRDKHKQIRPTHTHTIFIIINVWTWRRKNIVQRSRRHIFSI